MTNHHQPSGNSYLSYQPTTTSQPPPSRPPGSRIYPFDDVTRIRPVRDYSPVAIACACFWLAGFTLLLMIGVVLAGPVRQFMPMSGY
ncbi:MAG: hypothetical protein AB7K09_09770 [Planctomycetota bacterium]